MGGEILESVLSIYHILIIGILPDGRGAEAPNDINRQESEGIENEFVLFVVIRVILGLRCPVDCTGLPAQV
jgi:hypothetical protein